MKLIGGNAVDFRGLDSTYGPQRSFAPTPRPQEPIPVQVRVRPYADVLPEMTQVRVGGPNLGRLPVGAMLDCYI
jgi:hypothetical protein